MLKVENKFPFDKEHRDLQKRKKYMRPTLLLIASTTPHPAPFLLAGTSFVGLQAYTAIWTTVFH